MNLISLYGKPVQVMLWENWSRNAVGILQASPLGGDCCMLVPMEKDDPLLKGLPIGSVANPLHFSVHLITGIFELKQTSGNS